MPTFEMDEAGKTAQVKSIFDPTPVGAEHYRPTSLDGLGAAQPEEDTDTVGLPDGYPEGDPEDTVDVEYLADGGERIVTSYYQPGHEGCGRTGASCPTNEHASPWDHA